MSQDFVTLVSKDDKEYVISRSAAMISPTLKAMIEGPFRESKGRIELKQFDSHILEKAVEYLNYNLKYSGVSEDDDEIPEFEIPTEMSLELLLAADYLSI
ncbi:BAD_HP_G0014230.mRNA.1.CDS.1 [Saccharomyces cerevisiae]|nr:CDA_G0054990.mRNA.1.CDS.1 [Saccharomyces cerevisiae]CAI4857138.1 CCT_1a_G0055840.mRNA.1.CDS.1 [Saccharomyces cerevisiae]CAI4927821.1 BAD_HP_G0014230.mRNA.1.CDS.1 [Saccharomyces cerevisiae]CAI6465563.1 BAD_HP_G0014230.mRNA.1.CDS.1 [Saccharomyces cerevisiae]CAI7481254.1 CDA_G0054990.mRNA.1.CDS.1 [Saccharomyces cerevisiae]